MNESATKSVGVVECGKSSLARNHSNHDQLPNAKAPSQLTRDAIRPRPIFESECESDGRMHSKRGRPAKSVIRPHLRARMPE